MQKDFEQVLNNTQNFSRLRCHFPMLMKKMHGKPLIYFDSAATAQKPQCVIDALSNFYTNQYGTVHRSVYQLSSSTTESYIATREIVKAFINAKSTNEIIYTKGTTESINLVAYSFGKAFVKPKDEIIISEMEHHSNIVPWQILCEDRGARLKIIPMNQEGELDLQAYKRLLSDRTKMVAIGHISNSLGTIHPIKEIIADAHAAGSKVLIDGAQGVPHLPINVQDLDADFYAFSGHKLYGPTGIGILYAKEELLNAMPPYQGGGDMIQTVTFEKTNYNEPPLKFEAGTPMIAEVLGLGASLRFLSEIGIERIFAHEQQLLKEATSQLSQIQGLKIIGNAKEKGAIISFVIDQLHPFDIGTLLDLQGVAVRTGHHCTQPIMQRFGLPGTTRVSFALYNTEEEIGQFTTILKQVINTLR